MSQTRPFVSVIVPTYNRPRQLATCLQALAQLDYPRYRFEVIVVDDCSDTPLEPVILPFRSRMNLMLLKQANAGPAAARNIGAKQAQGEFLAFTDDDCAPAPDWLSALAQRFAATPDRIIGGRTINKLSNNIYACTSQLIVDIVYRHFNADPNAARFLTSNNMAVPAKRFRELGGFNVDFRTSEDRELCDRWLFHGYRMTYAPEAVVYHAHDLNLWGFCKQHFGYGRGAYHYNRIRAVRGSGNLREEMKFHFNWRNWLLYPLTQVKSRQAFYLAVWQVANTAGFFSEAMSQKFGQRN